LKLAVVYRAPAQWENSDHLVTESAGSHGNQSSTSDSDSFTPTIQLIRALQSDDEDEPQPDEDEEYSQVRTHLKQKMKDILIC